MVMEYVTSVKVVLEIAKGIKAATDAIDNADIKLQAAKLISALANAEIQAAESAELIASLQQQIKSKSEMKFNGSVYYRATDAGKEKDPYCQVCFDKETLEIHLQKELHKNQHGKVTTYWLCKVCKNNFKQRDETLNE